MVKSWASFIDAGRLKNLSRCDQFEFIKQWLGDNYFVFSCSDNAKSKSQLVADFTPEDVLKIEFGMVVEYEVLEDVINYYRGVSGFYDVIKINAEYSRSYVKEMVRCISLCRDFSYSIGYVNDMLDIKASDDVCGLLRNMSYSFLFSVYEAYLARAFAFAICQDRQKLAKFMKTEKKFKKKFQTLDHFEISDRHEREAEKIILSRIVWHGHDDAFRMYKEYLGIGVVFDSEFMATCVSTRHDIIHRAGKTLSGVEVVLDHSDVTRLVCLFSEIVEQIDKSLPCKVVIVPKLK